MAEEALVSISERLGQEFWTQPGDAMRSGAMQLIYGNLVAVFQDELKENGGSLVDYMIAERASLMYSYMRERESSNAPGLGMTDRNRREMNKDLIDLLLTIKKLWAADAKDDQAERVLAKVNKAIFGVTKEMPEAEGKKLMAELASSFEQVGL